MNHQRINILLVEDNPGDARLIWEFLAEGEAGQFEITHVEELGDALQRLDEERFDMVLLDLSLPDSHGLVTFDKIHGRALDVPIIVLTGLDDETLAVKAVQKGAQDYLVKGQVDGSLLVRSVRYAIERHRVVAEQLHDAQRVRTGKVLGFIGAKGGVGTTTVALNVASALAQKDKRVIALELRSSHGTFALQMNQTPGGNLGDLLDLDPERIDQGELNMRLFNTPFGFSVLFCPQKIGEFKEIEPRQAEAVIKGLAGMADYTVVDFPCHPSGASQAAMSLCNFVTVVVEPDPICVNLAKVTLELLTSGGMSGGRMGVVVVNRTPLPSSMSPPAIQSQLGLEIMGVVPPAAEALMAAHAQPTGTPIVLYQPTSLAAMNLSEIATRLAADKPTGMRF